MKKSTKKIYDLYHDEDRDVFSASIKDLRKILGEPVYADENDKISQPLNFEWIMETDNGDIFVVWPEYPYAEVLDEDEIIEWHIGGHNGAITYAALNEISEELNELEV